MVPAKHVVPALAARMAYGYPRRCDGDLGQPFFVTGSCEHIARFVDVYAIQYLLLVPASMSWRSSGCHRHGM